MRTSLAAPPVFAIAQKEPGHIVLAANNGAVAHIFVLEDDIVRVAVLPVRRLAHAEDLGHRAGPDDVPLEGRDRLDLSGFSLPAYACSEADGRLVVETAQIRLSVALQGFFCSWETRQDGRWTKAARDRPTQAYNFGWWDDRVYHYLARDPREKYFGLGERSGDMDRAGRRFRMAQYRRDGLQRAASDPLYKHIPFYITCTPDDGLRPFLRHAVGLHVRHGPRASTTITALPQFRRRARRSRLLLHCVARHAARSPPLHVAHRAGPRFLPKWSLGYSGSTMSYTDAPDAQQRMNEFLEHCEAHDILCDSFHLSSGYTSIGDKRYVFNWNRDKFPDPTGFVAALSRQRHPPVREHQTVPAARPSAVRRMRRRRVC